MTQGSTETQQRPLQICAYRRLYGVIFYQFLKQAISNVPIRPCSLCSEKGIERVTMLILLQQVQSIATLAKVHLNIIVVTLWETELVFGW